jgi:citrate synthase
MTSADSKVVPGLEGIVVAETRLSHVDGAAGRLVIAGADVEDLASRGVPFEDVAARLWRGDGPAVDVDAVREALGRARGAAYAMLPSIGSALDAPDAMDALRGAVAQLREPSPSSSLPRWAGAALVTGAVAIFATAWARRRQSAEPVAPDPSLSHAADYLRMLRGRPASSREVSALDAYFVTVVDHGLNASTFAARVVASTGSDLVSAVTAALGALKGPLHGGAPGPVLDMLDAIGRASQAREWIDAELNAGRRIMGMGHRVYRTRDPRAAVLEGALGRLRETLGRDEEVRPPLGESGGTGAGRVSARLELARAVEREATALLGARHADRALRANVEFYTAVLLEAIGVPRELFTATFAASRVAGWAAHVDEQRRTGRLIRPASVYVGAMPELRS